jgi:hypothetical protein
MEIHMEIYVEPQNSWAEAHKEKPLISPAWKDLGFTGRGF